MTNKLYSPILIESVKASVDLEQYRFIGFDGNYCQAGAKAFGVTDVSTEKEQFAPIAIFGTLLIEAGGAISAGDAVASDDEGKAVKTADSSIINGYAIDDGTLGQIIRIIRGI